MANGFHSTYIVSFSLKGEDFEMSVTEEPAVNMSWIQPEIIKNDVGEEINKTPIMVTNSLTRTKVYFISSFFI